MSHHGMCPFMTWCHLMSCRHVMLCSIMSSHITCHAISCRVMSSREVMFCCVLSFHMISCHVTLIHVLSYVFIYSHVKSSCYVMSRCHVMLCNALLLPRHVLSFHVISCHFLLCIMDMYCHVKLYLLSCHAVVVSLVIMWHRDITWHNMARPEMLISDNMSSCYVMSYRHAFMWYKVMSCKHFKSCRHVMSSSYFVHPLSCHVMSRRHIRSCCHIM